jgi:hypothetical protein
MVSLSNHRRNALWRSIGLAIVLISFFVAPRASAAEATTGSIFGAVASSAGVPIAGAAIDVVSTSGRYAARSDAHGRFALFGIAPDAYTVVVRASGYEGTSRTGVVVLPGQREALSFVLVSSIKTIATVHSSANAFTVGSTSDTFTVSGDRAAASSPVTASSGLGNYLSGTVQGAIAAVPGVEEDAFANAILRGGKISDATYDYDSIPIPQGIVAEPGGNIVGAQLPTTGIASSTVTLAGYEAQGENALGGIIDEIPATGVYPGRTRVDLTGGYGALNNGVAIESLWATPDLRWRYGVSTTLSSQYFSYGNGQFYPAEIGTYGLALQSRGQSTISGNVHFALDPHDDLSLAVLAGQSEYNQYGTPYAGEVFGAFGGGGPSGSPVDFASGLRGNYGLAKFEWAHSSTHSLARLQVYHSFYASSAGGPFWDDLSFPDGVISLSAQQGAHEDGIEYDVDDVASDHHELKYGAVYKVNTSFLNQVVPTADEFINSNPTLASYLLFAGDTWSISRRLDLTGVARLSGTDVKPGDGPAYDVGALDPHLAAAYRVGSDWSLRATFDHTTVAPEPLEADRVDSANPAPFVPLAPEIGRQLTYSVEGGTRTKVRVTYFASDELNRIDVLPFNFRSATSTGENPDGVGVPTNAGELRAHGLEVWMKNGGLELDANLIRAQSSSASQFAFNDLNAAAVAAGQLFPVSYIPDLSLQLSYEIDLDHRHVRITPSLSYESGYPYGNGKMIWIFNPVTNKPEQVPNDNFENPGFNYYFLQNPALPYNAQSNPYIGSLGTNEGNDPNTLHTTPQTIVSLHTEVDVAPHVTAIFDIFNLLDVTTPTQLQGNPYLIGPPGYTGGNALYSAAYGADAGFPQYTLGNGIPTNNGLTAAVPWNYGRAGYVPMSYPLARTLQVTLRYRL